MILRNLSAAADWKFAARAMDQQTGSFRFLCDLLDDIGFEVVDDGDDWPSALVFAPGVAAPVGAVCGASEAIVTFDDPAIWEEDDEVCIPCPEPSPSLSVFESMKVDVDDCRSADHGWRRGLDEAARGGADRPWFGGSVWGRAYQAGLAYGRQFV